MLVNKDFFYGDLAVAQKTAAAVADSLDWFIAKYEAEFLKSLLGYATYKSLLEGLQISPVPLKWQRLLYGGEYTDKNGHLDYFDGLITGVEQAQQVAGFYLGEPIPVVVNRGQIGDPVAGQDAVQVPEIIKGKKFSIEQRLLGTLIEGTEYTVDTDGLLTLLGGVKFSNADTYFYKSSFGISFSDSEEVGFKGSCIASYILYWYLRNQASTTGGNGEAKTKTQNADPVDNLEKQARAWNASSEGAKAAVSFMLSSVNDYPEFNGYFYSNKCHINGAGVRRLLKPISSLGI